MKRKKPLIIVIIVVVIVCAVLYLLSGGGKVSYIRKASGFDIRGCKILKDTDTHGGFLGDGEYILIADCRENPQSPENLKGWKELPLTENIRMMMYGGAKDGVEYGFELAEHAGIPYIEKGYYYFENRHPDAEDRESDEDIFDLVSFNFTLALYDSEADMFYFYEFDT